jgi:hypothetical protein
VILGLSACVFGAWGWMDLAATRARFASVEGVVTSSVYWPTHPSANGDCARRFRWEYQFNGETFEASNWNQRLRSHTCAQLEAHIRTHPEGMAVAGFHDTEGKAHAFLYAVSNPDVALVIPLGGAFFFIGVYFLRRYPRGAGTEPLRRYGQWYHLRTGITRRETMTLWALATAWILITLFPNVHWYERLALVAHDMRRLQLIGLGAAFGCAVGWFIVRSRAVAYDEIAVAIDQPTLRRGEKVTVRVTQPFRTPVRILTLKVGMACRYVEQGRRHARVVTAGSVEETHELNKSFGAGTRLEMLTTLDVPHDRILDGLVDHHPTWYVTVRVDGAGIADAEQSFPIPYEATPSRQRR